VAATDKLTFHKVAQVDVIHGEAAEALTAQAHIQVGGHKVQAVEVDGTTEVVQGPQVVQV
jgi:hypothetical protein